MGGQVITNAQESALSSEAVGLMIAALVLVLTFGTLVAAGLPIVTALFGLGISSAVVGLLAAVHGRRPTGRPRSRAMIGLGVGIDYALLILTRYRAGAGGGLEPREAAVEAVSTAGRSVLIAGTTVVISLLGLFLMGLPYLQGVALSASFAVLVDDGRVGHAAAGAARLRGHAGSTGCGSRAPRAARAADPARARRALEPRRAAAPVGRPRSPAPRCCSCSPRRSSACGSASPTRGNDRAGTTTRQAYDLVVRGLRRRARTARCCSSPSCTARRPRRRSTALAGAPARASPAIAAVGRRRVNPAGDAAVITATPDDLAAVDARPRTWSTTCATTSCRARACRSASAATTASFVDQSEVDRRPAAAVHRRRRRALVPAAARRVPLRHRGAQGRA